MTAYFDSSALVVVYVTEAYSARVSGDERQIALVRAEGLRALDIRAGT